MPFLRLGSGLMALHCFNLPSLFALLKPNFTILLEARHIDFGVPRYKTMLMLWVRFQPGIAHAKYPGLFHCCLWGNKLFWIAVYSANFALLSAETAAAGARLKPKRQSISRSHLIVCGMSSDLATHSSVVWEEVTWWLCLCCPNLNREQHCSTVSPSMWHWMQLSTPVPATASLLIFARNTMYSCLLQWFVTCIIPRRLCSKYACLPFPSLWSLLIQFSAKVQGKVISLNARCSRINASLGRWKNPLVDLT